MTGTELVAAIVAAVIAAVVAAVTVLVREAARSKHGRDPKDETGGRDPEHDEAGAMTVGYWRREGVGPIIERLDRIEARLGKEAERDNHG